MTQSKASWDVLPASADTSGDSVYAKAAADFAAIHEQLAEVGEGAVLSRQARKVMWEALERARDPVSSAEAKRLQIEAAGGRPLTVCFGRRVRRIQQMKQFVDTDVAHTPFGDGCGVVFADSEARFRHYCSHCRKKPGGRLRADVLRRTVAAVEGRFAVPGGWRLTCTGCNERFFATTPQRRRCDRCRH